LGLQDDKGIAASATRQIGAIGQWLRRAYNVSKDKSCLTRRVHYLSRLTGGRPYAFSRSPFYTVDGPTVDGRGQTGPWMYRPVWLLVLGRVLINPLL